MSPARRRLVWRGVPGRSDRARGADDARAIHRSPTRPPGRAGDDAPTSGAWRCSPSRAPSSAIIWARSRTSSTSRPTWPSRTSPTSCSTAGATTPPGWNTRPSTCRRWPSISSGFSLRAAGHPRPGPLAASAWYADTSRRFETSASLVAARVPMVILGALGCVAIYAIGTRAFGRACGARRGRAADGQPALLPPRAPGHVGHPRRVVRPRRAGDRPGGVVAMGFGAGRVAGRRRDGPGGGHVHGPGGPRQAQRVDRRDDPRRVGGARALRRQELALESRPGALDGRRRARRVRRVRRAQPIPHSASRAARSGRPRPRSPRSRSPTGSAW